jgi:hypothetical protein
MKTNDDLRMEVQGCLDNYNENARISPFLASLHTDEECFDWRLGCLEQLVGELEYVIQEARG